MKSLMLFGVTSWLVFGLTSGCSSSGENLFGDGTAAGTGGAGGGVSGGTAERIDLLLTIDNSRLMEDKQQILADSVDALVDGLLNPLCFGDDALPGATQPATGDEPCPAGTNRLFSPVTDIRIGVITSSLGGHGADVCAADMVPMENDKAHLVARAPGGGSVATYDDLGFLAWDPAGEQSPAGEDDRSAFEASLRDLVMGSGALGCGFEAQHESWYRFLVEPDPHESIAIEGGSAQLKSTDQVLLGQRADFLRPDSLLAILVLSDENDCSMREGGQNYFIAQALTPGTSQPYHLPKPRAACASDPYGACCVSCGQPAPAGCDTSNDDCTGTVSILDDNINRRCHDQKRRFGIDFLYPIERYVSGLTLAQIQDRHGNLVDNPIFAGGVRTAQQVFLTAIAGVPWQDIARQSGTTPDLTLGLMSAAELAAQGRWDVILGEPEKYVSTAGALPTDPLMIESVDPRSGENPITGDKIQPAGAATLANPINGHEYSNPQRGDLQYACIFELPQPRDCSGATGACDCTDPANDNPLCQDSDNNFTTLQYRAKAYPGVRHLQLVRAMDAQGVLGSICPAQLDDPSASDFGYAPALRSMLEAFGGQLK